MQTEDAPELTPEFLEDLRRYTEYGWGPGITAALLNRWHPVALNHSGIPDAEKTDESRRIACP